nr:hypothetical protein Iba_chr15aCG13080 [Ipomoea batatas]
MVIKELRGTKYPTTWVIAVKFRQPKSYGEGTVIASLQVWRCKLVNAALSIWSWISVKEGGIGEPSGDAGREEVVMVVSVRKSESTN